MKPVIAGLLCLMALNALADTKKPAADTRAAAVAASGAAAPPTTDDYINCSNLYIILSKMNGPKPDNLEAYIGITNVLAIVSSSESHVSQHQPAMLDAEVKKLEAAKAADALPTYLTNFRFRLRQCTDVINRGDAIYHAKAVAYVQSHLPAAGAASGK
jgi:hypothetical protein